MPESAGPTAADFEDHRGRCLARAVRILRDHQMAEDAVQEAFFDHWRYPGRFDAARTDLGSWLVMLTQRRAVDRVRSEQRRAAASLDALTTDLPDERPPTEELALRREQADRARRALGALPSEQREVLVLSHWGGFTQPEIARVTGRPLGSVKTSTRIGVRALGVALAPHVGQDGGNEI